MLKPNSFRDRNLVRTTIMACSITKSDLVYVIEPENELVTSELAVAAKKVVVLVRHPKRAHLLSTRFQDIENVEVREVDFLHYVIQEQAYKVFSNVISIVTSRMIKKLLYARVPPHDSFLVMQEDAANRYSGTPKETESSVLIKPWFDVTIHRTFQRSNFKPVPSVDIVLLNLKMREKPLIPSQDANIYRKFISFSFEAGKKGLDIGYMHIFTDDQWMQISRDVGVKLSIEPTQLTFDQWLQIYAYFAKLIPDSKKKPLMRKKIK